MEYFDISLPLKPALPVYPGDPPIEIETIADVGKGDAMTVSRIAMSTHAGTHLDAPRHAMRNGMSVDEIPLSLLIGRVMIVDMSGVTQIGRKELSRRHVKGETRVLLKTANSALWQSNTFSESYSFLTRDGAEYLVDAGVKLVGIDYISVEKYGGDGSVHNILLGEGVAILEGVNLAHVPAGAYELICLPLKIEGGDGAPVRAVLWRAVQVDLQSEFDPHTTRWPIS